MADSIEHTFRNIKDNTVSGTIRLLGIRKEVYYSMLDYLRGGTQMALVVGIDFTGSNGSPNMPSSNHYMNPVNPNQLNCYQQAIVSVGSILLNYDHDKMV